MPSGGSDGKGEFVLAEGKLSRLLHVSEISLPESAVRVLAPGEDLARRGEGDEVIIAFHRINSVSTRLRRQGSATDQQRP